MKKLKIFTIVIFMLFPALKANAQFEVIDKIAEVLIPGITGGIKSVMESRSGNKVKKEEVGKLKKELISQTKKIISSMDSDIGNLSALNELFSISGNLNDDIGVLLAITNPRFLESIKKTESELLYKETAIMFSSRWRQIINRKDKLKKISSDSAGGSVADDINIYVSNIEQNLISLEGTVGLSKDPTHSMTYKESETYVINLDRARTSINNIATAISNINTQLSSRINSFKKSLANAKKGMENMINEDK